MMLLSWTSCSDFSLAVLGHRFVSLRPELQARYLGGCPVHGMPCMHACAVCFEFHIRFQMLISLRLDLFKEKKRRMKLNLEVTSSLLGSLAAGGLFRAGGATCCIIYLVLDVPFRDP